MDGGDKQDDHSIATTKDDDDFKIKGAARRVRSNGRESPNASSQDGCIICLQPISERAVASPCNHLEFDFLCLVTWLQGHATCPLCKATVEEVQYDWTGPDDYKVFRVPQPSSESSRESAFERTRRRRGQDFIRRSVARLESQRQQHLAGQDSALNSRRIVYRDRLFSLHVGANSISQHHSFTPQDFAASSRLQFRARTFLRRELQVFTFLDPGTAPRGRNREFVIELIVAILKTDEVKGADGHAEDVLSDYLGRDNTKLLLHELESWLKSPFQNLEAWDNYVQYANDGRVSKNVEPG